jgi:hypothetical protein
MYSSFSNNTHEVGDTTLQNRVVICEKRYRAGQVRYHPLYHGDDILKCGALCQSTSRGGLKQRKPKQRNKQEHT